MNNTSCLDTVRDKARQTSDSKPQVNSVKDLPNAVDSEKIPMLLRKNRHLSGLMCPPAGKIPEEEHLRR